MNKETENKISDSVLERIEKSNQKPHSKTYFKVKNWAVWFFAGAATLAGALFVSSLIFRLINIERALPPHLEELLERKNLILHDFPVVLFVLFILFLFLAYKEIRLTRSGYKYELPMVLLSIGFTSLLLGLGFYVVGTGYHVDKITSKGIPLHMSIERIQERRWLEPVDGVIIGRVVGFKDSQIILKDPRGNDWKVFLDVDDEEEGRDVDMFIGQRVGFLGEGDVDNFIFNACDIKSLELERPNSQKDSGRNIFNVRINKCEERTTSQLINN